LAAEIISTGVFEDDESGEESAQAAERRLCELPAEMHGWRADRAIARLIPEFSRSYLQQLMADGAVELRGVPLRKPASHLKVGDRLTVELRHPAAGHWSGTLLNGLLAHHSGAAQLPRAGIVHRLDKDTSGLMLVGKSRQAVEALGRAIAAREVQREYLALAHGSWRGPSVQEVDQTIGRDSHNRLRMAVLRPDATSGKTARTTVTLLATQPELSLVRCKLHTGRTHQIRVHMAWLGHPLVGDSLYGGRPLWGLARQALHAQRLRLAHPISGTPLDFCRAPPADLLSALTQCGLPYNAGLVD
jgi:23S rRNA pseudouridine1911/1915/1917 synthase